MYNNLSKGDYMKRRANGEGSWGKKTVGRNTYYYFKNTEGKFFYGKTKSEVQEKIKNYKKEEYNLSSEKLTFGEYIKYWLYEIKYKEVGINLQATTFDAYEDALSQRFFKHPLANRQAQAVTADNLNDYFKELALKYRRGTITKTWNILRNAINEDRSKFSNLNVEKVKVPTESNVVHKKKQISFTSNEDMEILYKEAFRKTLRGTPVYGTAAYMLVFIMYSGLRLAEACGLKWENVDLKNEMISIVSTTTRVKVRDNQGTARYKIIDKDPKSKDSSRTIPYRKRAGEILQLIEEQNPNHLPGDYVFLTHQNNPYSRRTVERTLKRMLENSDVSTKEYTPHSLRHGYGSILYQQNVPIKTISELLGHADISTTANIYIGVSTDTLKEALNRVDNAPQN